MEGELPEELKTVAELYVGCVSGALQKSEYLESIRKAGFLNVDVVRQKEISVAEELLAACLTPEQKASYSRTGLRVLSITVKATKPE